jgi:peptidoglycan/xylan/chitin deacetylase (PgdA/CDA1 family)
MGKVALTFDMEAPGQAHWSVDAPGMILDTLARAEVQATFFVQGRWAQAMPELVRRAVGEGHTIGCHSWAHARWSGMTLEGLLEDIEKGTEAVMRAGADPRPWARAPFGATSEESERALGLLGYESAWSWNVDPGDWMPTVSANEIVSRVIDQTRRIGGDTMVLLHTWPMTTAVALPHLVRGLQEAGAEFTQLLRLEPA